MSEDIEWFSHTPVRDRFRGAYLPSTLAANKLALQFHRLTVERGAGVLSLEDVSKATVEYLRDFGPSYAEAYKRISQECSEKLPGDADCVALGVQLIWF
jgi:hypothetical protein